MPEVGGSDSGGDGEGGPAGSVADRGQGLDSGLPPGLSPHPKPLSSPLSSPPAPGLAEEQGLARKTELGRSWLRLADVDSGDGSEAAAALNRQYTDQDEEQGQEGTHLHLGVMQRCAFLWTVNERKELASITWTSPCTMHASPSRVSPASPARAPSLSQALGVQTPEAALARFVLGARDLHEALVEREVVADRVL